MKKIRILIALFLVLVSSIVATMPVMAATTADITNTATPKFIAITVDPTTKAWGAVAASATPSTATDAFTVDNTSSIATDVEIAVTAATWAGGATWTHSDTATAGADTAGLLANKGGSWETGDVIVKYGTPNDISANQAATTDFSFGLKLLVPTSFSDGVEKSITVRLTATEH